VGYTHIVNIKITSQDVFRADSHNTENPDHRVGNISVLMNQNSITHLDSRATYHTYDS